MLPKSRRITRQAEWDKLHKFGRRAHSPELVLGYLKTTNKQSRFGFIVGTKVSKKSAVRNQIKRRIRAIIENNLAKIQGNSDIIFVAKAKIKELEYPAMEEKVLILLKKQGLLRK